MNQIATNRFDTFARQLSELPTEQRDHFFEKLTETCSPEEVQALRVGFAWYVMAHDPEKYNAIKRAVGQKLYQTFTAAN